MCKNSPLYGTCDDFGCAKNVASNISSCDDQIFTKKSFKARMHHHYDPTAQCAGQSKLLCLRSLLHITVHSHEMFKLIEMLCRDIRHLHEKGFEDIWKDTNAAANVLNMEEPIAPKPRKALHRVENGGAPSQYLISRGNVQTTGIRHCSIFRLQIHSICIQTRTIMIKAG